MSTHIDPDFDFGFDFAGDEAAFAEADRAFTEFMQEEAAGLITEDDQARYEEWCEDNGLSAAEDHWDTYFEDQVPDDEEW